MPSARQLPLNSCSQNGEGLVVPVIRKFSKKYSDLSVTDLQKLIQSQWHEERLLALLILVLQYQRSKDLKIQKTIYKFYVKRQKFIIDDLS